MEDPKLLGNNRAASNAPFEVWKIYRDYVVHEDNLINHRTGWGITIQSFTIATFGLSYQKKYEISAKIFQDASKPTISITEEPANPEAQKPVISVTENEYNLFLILIVIVGFFCAWATFASIKAAISSLNSLSDKWDTVKAEHFELQKYLPNLRGGSTEDAKNHRLGNRLPYLLPMFFMIFWPLVLLFIIFYNPFIGIETFEQMKMWGLKLLRG